MVNMRPLQEEIEVGNFVRHDQEHHGARSYKGQNKAEQGAARQAVRRRPVVNRFLLVNEFSVHRRT